MTDTPDDPMPFEEISPTRGKKKLSIVSRMPGDDIAATETDLFLAFRTTNDIGNAERLVKRFGDDLMHVDGQGWLAWDEVHWNRKRGPDMALELAQETSRAIWREVKVLREDKALTDPDRVGFLAQHAVQSGNMGRVNAMLDAAQPRLAIELELLDADPWIVYTPNAALRVYPEQRVVERDRAHRVTRLCRADYRAGIACPLWDAFIDMIFPDKAIGDFVQRAAGYSLTGDMSEESFFMCWGKGRNGKGTFLRVIAFVLGTLAATIPVELLLEGSMKSGNEASPQYAALSGVRFAMTTEPSPGARFNEGELKTLTGRDTIRIRGLYEKPFDLVPKFKLWIACNDRPSVRSASDAYWRRVKLVPFVVNITEEQTDKRLEEKLRAESSGILNWMLMGLADWAERGLAPPEAVIAANQSYRDEMDPLHRFLIECTQMAVGYDLRRTDLWSAYLAWCSANGEDHLKPRTFGIALTNKGWLRKTSNGTVYRDMGLTPEGFEMREKGELMSAKKSAWGNSA